MFISLEMIFLSLVFDNSYENVLIIPWEIGQVTENIEVWIFSYSRHTDQQIVIDKLVFHSHVVGPPRQSEPQRPTRRLG